MSPSTDAPGPSPLQPPVPRYQFRVWHLLALPVLAVAVLLYLDSQSLLPRYPWTDHLPMTIDFEVTGKGGKPLEGVAIEVFRPSGQTTAQGRTGPDGHASLSGDFGISGSRTIFRRLNDAKVEPFQYRMQAAGYQSVETFKPYTYYYGGKTPRLRFRWGLTAVE